VNAGYNALDGTIPGDLWRLSNLELLILSDNQIDGPLPTNLTQNDTASVEVTGDSEGESARTSTGGDHSYEALKELRLWWMARNTIQGSLPTDLFLGLQSSLESYVPLIELTHSGGPISDALTYLSRFQAGHLLQ
jgi:hypothetical protein